MTTLQKVCGLPSGPVAGQTKYQNDLLVNAILHFIILDNTPQNGLSPSPDYKFDTIAGEIDISPNTFGMGNKIIFVYSKSCN